MIQKKRTGSDAKASRLIINMIAELDDWRGKLVARLRKLILEVAPYITEEWKWGTAVWRSNGLVCAARAFKDHVKLNFFTGGKICATCRGIFVAVKEGHPAYHRW
jgi:hypothetical protein